MDNRTANHMGSLSRKFHSRLRMMNPKKRAQFLEAEGQMDGAVRDRIAMLDPPQAELFKIHFFTFGKAPPTHALFLVHPTALAVHRAIREMEVQSEAIKPVN